MVARVRCDVQHMFLSDVWLWLPSVGRPRPLMYSVLTKPSRGWQYVLRTCARGPYARAAKLCLMSCSEAGTCQLAHFSRTPLLGCSRTPRSTGRGPCPGAPSSRRQGERNSQNLTYASRSSSFRVAKCPDSTSDTDKMYDAFMASHSNFKHVQAENVEAKGRLMGRPLLSWRS
jgi:hypothetical protein